MLVVFNIFFVISVITIPLFVFTLRSFRFFLFLWWFYHFWHISLARRRRCRLTSHKANLLWGKLRGFFPLFIFGHGQFLRVIIFTRSWFVELHNRSLVLRIWLFFLHWLFILSGWRIWLLSEPFEIHSLISLPIGDFKLRQIIFNLHTMIFAVGSRHDPG